MFIARRPLGELWLRNGQPFRFDRWTALWHLPIAGPITIPLVVLLVVAQLVIGLILSWLWRRSGNMAMPATVHAVLDAVRNALTL